MKLLQAMKALEEGKMITSKNMPLGKYIRLVGDKILDSNGYEGIDLNTDEEYYLYEESEPKHINEIQVLLEEIGSKVVEDCKYDCNKCKLNVNEICLMYELSELSQDYDYNLQQEKIKSTYKKQVEDIFDPIKEGYIKIYKDFTIDEKQIEEISNRFAEALGGDVKVCLY